MSKWIDGPPTTPGDYRVVSITGWQAWGRWDGNMLHYGKDDGCGFNLSSVGIAKHAYLDAPNPAAAEWLGKERLPEFVNKRVAIRLDEGEQVFGYLTRVTADRFWLANRPGDIFDRGKVEDFCEIQLPKQKPAPLPVPRAFRCLGGRTSNDYAGYEIGGRFHFVTNNGQPIDEPFVRDRKAMDDYYTELVFVEAGDAK